MPRLYIALRGPFNLTETPPSPLTSPLRLALPGRAASLDGFSSIRADVAPFSLYLNPVDLTLAVTAIPDTPHFFRLADGTVKPLPSDPALLTFSPGDAYIALNPVALDLADSPAIAGFLHLRDYFNADKLGDALLKYLTGLAGLNEPPVTLSILIIECR